MTEHDPREALQAANDAKRAAAEQAIRICCDLTHIPEFNDIQALQEFSRLWDAYMAAFMEWQARNRVGAAMIDPVAAG